ncbi:MAG: AAA family ATPase [Pseudomonadota bacterium]
MTSTRAESDTNGTPPPGWAPADDSGQFRPITVVFIDLVGSTRISRQLEREESRRIIKQFRNQVVAVVEAFGGTTERAFGDALLIGFGHPKAHEDDPERAVRASQAVHVALEDLSTAEGRTYQASIGIATDMILVGDERDRVALQSDEYFGAGPILASRLQDEAEPGQTIICEDTAKYVRPVFELDDLRGLELKNFDEPVDAYRVVREISRTARQIAADKGTQRDLVGRKSELDLLMDRWRLACETPGQIVLIEGKPGIGKSHLMSAQRNHQALGKHGLVIYRCLRHSSTTPFFPFITQSELWCGIRASDGPDTRIQKLSERFGHILDSSQFAILSAMIVSTKDGERLLSSLVPDVFHAKVVEIYLSTMRALCSSSPMLLHFEDIHWIDSSSRRLLDEVIPVLADLPLMLVLSYRSGAGVEPWQDRHVTHLELDPLPSTVTQELVRRLPGADTFDQDTVEHISDVSAGLPLFVEHYTSLVKDLVKTGRPLPVFGDTADIPQQVFGLLFEQLDDTGSDRHVALAATAIGRPFDRDLLAAAAGLKADEASGAIERLIGQGLIVEAHSDSDLPYRMSHVMLQDAGYRSMLSGQREELHRRIAHYLENNRDDLVDLAPELLARQFSGAGFDGRAAEMFIEAGRKANARFAAKETADHARNGLGHLTKVAEPERSKLRMHLQFLLALAKSAKDGFGSAEALDAFTQSFELAEAAGDRRIFQRSAQGLFAAQQAHANFDMAASYGAHIHQLIAEGHPAADAKRGASLADHMIGVARTWQGRFAEARFHLRRGLDLSDGEMPQGDHGAPGTDQSMVALALVEAFMGNEADALRLARQAIATARRSGSPMSIGNAMLMTCNLYQVLRHPDALSNARALEAYALEQRMPFYVHGARSFVGVALYQDPDRVREGYDLLNEAWPRFKETAARANQVFVCVERAEGCLQMKDYATGLLQIEEGFRLAETYDERNFEAELYRVKGALLLASGDNSEAPMTCLTTALEIATRQDAKLFEARARSDLAALAETGRIDATDTADARNQDVKPIALGSVR